MQTRRTLYLRLMLAAVAPLALAGACSFVIALVVITHTLEGRTREQTVHAARVLSEAHLPFTPELLRRFAQLQRADFYLVDVTGGVALTSASHVPQGLLGLVKPGSPGATASFELEGVPVVAAMAPLNADDQRYRTLIAVAALTDAREAAKSAAAALAGALLIAIALLAFLVHLMVGSITRPLQALAEFAATLGSGQRGVRTAVGGQDELGRLEQALNVMSQQIDHYEAQLAAQSRLSALGEMAARIAHEVRNPLTGLKMHLQLLMERLPGSETPRLMLLLSEVHRLELVVNASVMLARERTPEFALEDLSVLIRTVLELMSPSLQHRGIQLEEHLTPLQPLTLDRALIKQALLNLLANAADALPAGGRIILRSSCQPERGMVSLSVEDSGEGFTREVLDAQGLQPGTSKPFGLGLGLGVCREVARLHGGELRLGAASCGGACVTLELPLQHPDPNARPEPVRAVAAIHD